MAARTHTLLRQTLRDPTSQGAMPPPWGMPLLTPAGQREHNTNVAIVVAGKPSGNRFTQ